MRSDKIYTWNEEKKHRSKILFSLSLSSLWNGRVGGEKNHSKGDEKNSKTIQKKMSTFLNDNNTYVHLSLTHDNGYNNDDGYYHQQQQNLFQKTPCQIHRWHTHTTRECCHSLSRILMSPLDVYQNVYFYPIVFYSFLTISCILYRSRKF